MRRSELRTALILATTAFSVIGQSPVDDLTLRARGQGVRELGGIYPHLASFNDGNDPIHRGIWVYEKLLAGVLADVPPNVDARLPEDPHKTLRERMEVLRRNACWTCHRKINPLGEAFENYDDFGRHRTKHYFDEEGRLITRRFDRSLDDDQIPDQRTQLERDKIHRVAPRAAGRSDGTATAGRHASSERPEHSADTGPGGIPRRNSGHRLGHHGTAAPASPWPSASC